MQIIMPLALVVLLGVVVGLIIAANVSGQSPTRKWTDVSLF